MKNNILKFFREEQIQGKKIFRKVKFKHKTKKLMAQQC